MSSIGKKLIMSITGAFLVLFLTFHAAMNFVAVLSTEAYDQIAAFLGANWYALVGTLVLALGFVFHIIFAVWLTWTNLKARGQLAGRYAVEHHPKGVSWAARNMLVLGCIIFLGLALHLYNFWYNMQLQEILGNHTNMYGYDVKQASPLLADLFAQPVYAILYIVWFFAIWFHLTHGIWSMFQSIGWASKPWYPRLKCIAKVYATILMLAYAAVVVAFYMKSI